MVQQEALRIAYNTARRKRKKEKTILRKYLIWPAALVHNTVLYDTLNQCRKLRYNIVCDA